MQMVNDLNHYALCIKKQIINLRVKSRHKKIIIIIVISLKQSLPNAYA